MQKAGGLTTARGFTQAQRDVADAVSDSPQDWQLLSSKDATRLLDRLSDGVIVLGADWRYRYLNDAAATMLGRAPGQLLGRHIWTEFPESTGLRLHLACEEVMHTGQPARIVEHDAQRGSWLESRISAYGAGVTIVLRDVTVDQVARNDLLDYADRFSEAERIVRFGTWTWERASGRVRWSDELHRIYGLEPGQFEGTADAFMQHMHPDDRERVRASIAHSVQTGEPFVFEKRINRADGEERVLLSYGRVIAGSDGALLSLMGVCHDVTDRAGVERALGASERRMRAIIDNTPSLIVVKDLSGRYLMCNAECDRVLGIRPEDIIGKTGFDLFPADIANLQRDAYLRAASEGEPVYTEDVLTVHGEQRRYVAVTFTLPDDDGFPVETATIATDVTERREREGERRERVTWRHRIESALGEQRMVVFAQPVVDLATGTRTSSELLVRMLTAGDRSELLAPDCFLPAAEHFGLIQSIDIWMVRQATTLSSSVVWQVNLSAVTMCDPAARHEIVHLLEAAPNAARRIVFEITETASVDHLEAAREFAHDIARLGCRLALDDFGTGFGSFTYLRSLPLSHIKIDISFVRGAVDSLDDRRVVQSIIEIAGQFDLKTIAEGVEDQATLELLREMGVDYAQGFHLGRPALLMHG